MLKSSFAFDSVRLATNFTLSQFPNATKGNPVRVLSRSTGVVLRATTRCPLGAMDGGIMPVRVAPVPRNTALACHILGASMVLAHRAMCVGESLRGKKVHVSRLQIMATTRTAQVPVNVVALVVSFASSSPALFSACVSRSITVDIGVVVLAAVINFNSFPHRAAFSINASLFNKKWNGVSQTPRKLELPLERCIIANFLLQNRIFNHPQN